MISKQSLSAASERPEYYEVEVKYSISRDYHNDLLACGFELIGRAYQIDNYFIVNEGRQDGRHYLRVRIDTAAAVHSLDYHIVTSDLSTKEIESIIETPANVVAMLEMLGYTLKCTVDKERISYRRNDIVVTCDLVTGLGRFLEVESIASDETTAYATLMTITNTLGLQSSARVSKKGYPDLLIEKFGIEDAKTA